LRFGGEGGYEVLQRRRITGIPRARPTVLAATMIPPGSQSPLARTMIPKIRQAASATVMIATRQTWSLKSWRLAMVTDLLSTHHIIAERDPAAIRTNPSRNPKRV
jgi:hypothetical protein